MYGAVASAGFAAGAVIGGLLVEASWRLVFFVNVPVGVVLFVASWRLLPADPPRRSGRLDVAGALAATAGVALLVLGVTRAGDTLQPTQPAVAVGAALVLLIAFVVREHKAAAPLLNLDLLKDRGILGANECLLAYGACNAAAVLLVTLYLQEGRGLRPLLTGLCFIPQAVGAFALAGPASKLVPALGPRRALAAGMSLGLLALVGSALSVARGPLVGLLASLFVMGVSARIVQVASTLAGTHGPVAARGEGSASAVLTASRQVGSALGVAVVSATLVTVHGNASHRTAVAMLVAAAFALVGLLTTRVVPSGPAPAALVATRAPLPSPRRRTSLTLYPNLLGPSRKCRLRAVTRSRQRRLRPHGIELALRVGVMPAGSCACSSPSSRRAHWSPFTTSRAGYESAVSLTDLLQRRHVGATQPYGCRRSMTPRLGPQAGGPTPRLFGLLPRGAKPGRTGPGVLNRRSCKSWRAA